MVRKIQFIIILFILVSCQSKQEKLIGHWHEFKTNKSDYLNCYHITDSTIGINPLSNGGYDDYERGSDIDQSELLSLANGNYNWTSDFKISGNKLTLNDSIFWIKQTNKRESFVSDFSAGLLLNINPFESTSTDYDYEKNDLHSGYWLFVGKMKKSVLEKFKKFDEDQFYLQINDKLANVNEIRRFLQCYHCDITMDRIFIHADKDTPKKFLNEIEAEILKNGNIKKQIFYLTINKTELSSGYNHSY